MVRIPVNLAEAPLEQDIPTGPYLSVELCLHIPDKSSEPQKRWNMALVVGGLLSRWRQDSRTPNLHSHDVDSFARWIKKGAPKVDPSTIPKKDDSKTPDTTTYEIRGTKRQGGDVESPNFLKKVRDNVKKIPAKAKERCDIM